MIYFHVFLIFITNVILTISRPCCQCLVLYDKKSRTTLALVMRLSQYLPSSINGTKCFNFWFVFIVLHKVYGELK